MSKTSSYRQALIHSLADPVEARHYLKAVLEDYPEGFLKALRNVAQANQMTKVAQDAGIQRESLYRALSDNGNPTFDTLTSILNALAIKFTIALEEKESTAEVQPVAAAPIRIAPPTLPIAANPMDSDGQKFDVQDAVWMAQSNQYGIQGDSPYGTVRNS